MDPKPPVPARRGKYAVPTSAVSVDAAGSSTTDTALMAEGLEALEGAHKEFEEVVEMRALQDARDKAEIAYNFANVNHNQHAMDAASWTAAEKARQTAIEQLIEQIKLDTNEKIDEIVAIYRNLTKQNDNKLAQLDALYNQCSVAKREREIMLVKHGIGSTAKTYADLVNKYVKREPDTYDAALAKEELKKYLADRSYVPLMPPGSHKQWTDQEEWFKISYYALDIFKNQLPGAWPAFFDKPCSWGDIKDVMEEKLLPFYTANRQDICKLGGVTNEKYKTDFGAAIIQERNNTFLPHYQKREGLGGKGAYYTDFYTGIITCLRLKKQVAELQSAPGAPANPPVLATEDPLPQTLWTHETMMTHVYERFAGKLRDEKSEKALLGEYKIINMLARIAKVSALATQANGDIDGSDDLRAGFIAATEQTVTAGGKSGLVNRKDDVPVSTPGETAPATGNQSDNPEKTGDAVSAAALLASNETLLEELEQSKHSGAKLREKIDTLKSSLSEAAKRIKHLESVVQQLVDGQKLLEKEKLVLGSDLNKIHFDYDEIMETKRQIEEANLTLQNCLDHLGAEYNKAVSELAALKIVAGNSSVAIQENQAQQEELERTKAACTKLQKKMDTIQTSLLEAENRIAQLQSHEQDLRKQQQILKKEKETLRSDLDQAHIENGQNQKLKVQLREENQKLKSDLERLAADSDPEETERLREALEGKETEAGNLRSELDALQVVAGVREERIAQLTSEQEHMVAQQQYLEGRNETLEEMLDVAHDWSSDVTKETRKVHSACQEAEHNIGVLTLAARTKLKEIGQRGLPKEAGEDERESSSEVESSSLFPALVFHRK